MIEILLVGFFLLFALFAIWFWRATRMEGLSLFGGVEFTSENSGAAAEITVSPAPVVTDPTPVQINPPPPPVVTPTPPAPTALPSPRLPNTEHMNAPQTPAAWLVARGGPRAGKEFGLQRGHNNIGRDRIQSDVVLNDTTVSKRHAALRYENGQFVLYDLASTNGTFVNNRRVQKQGLLDGDDVRFGSAAFVFKAVKSRAVEPKSQ